MGGVLCGAQGPDVRRGTGGFPPAGPCAGRDDEHVVGQLSAALQVDSASRGIHAPRHGAQPQIQSEGVQFLRLAQQWRVGARALQYLFRQRRPVVGRLGLRADHDDGPAEAEPAQFLCHGQTTEAGAHDHHLPHVGPHVLSSPLHAPLWPVLGAVT